MRLRTKLLLAFLLPSLFPLLPSIFGTVQLHELGEDVKGLERTTQTEDLRAQVHLEVDLIPDPNRLARLESVADLVHAEHARLLCRTLSKRVTSATSIAAVTSMERSIETYTRTARSLIGKVQAEKSSDALLTAEGAAAQQAYDALRGAVGETTGGHSNQVRVLEPVATESREAVSDVALRSERRASKALLTGALGLGSALLLTLGASILLARVTERPILRLVQAARRVGQGDLEARVPVTEKDEDELAELARGFNEMVSQIRRFTAYLEDLVRERTEELRRREQDLERARKLAAVGRLAAGVAHEVSNPLAVIATSAEGLKDRVRENPDVAKLPGLEDLPDYLEHIEREAFRLKKLVRRLLDFARPGKDGGEGALARATLDLAEVAREAVALAALDPRAKKQPIDGAALEGRSIIIEGDADRLKEVVLNLLFNALDATKAGGSVSVTAATEGETAVLAVRDTGEGIAREDLERLFEPFFTTKPPGEGTGLGRGRGDGVAGRHARRAARGQGQGLDVRAAPAPPAQGAARPRERPLPRTPPMTEPVPHDTRERALPILLVDDEDGVRELYARELSRRGLQPTTAKNGEEGLGLLDKGQFPVVVCDVRMPGLSGLDVLKRIKERDGELTEVVMLTGHGAIDEAVEAMKAGAFTYLTKPMKAAELAAVVKSAGEKAALRRENLLLRREVEHRSGRGRSGAGDAGILGESAAWKKVIRFVEKAGPTGSTVLILGKSGTGKEGIARAIHRHSTRANRPFVAINCASVVATLLEAELFGHEAGAFTGAQKRRRGLFELADGGTLFLDELGETGTDFQAKLLRVLETGEFRRVGGETVGLATLRSDVRVVAATNRDLKEEIKSGRFREDLYYRLNVLEVELPSLAERKEDIPLLARHFLSLQPTSHKDREGPKDFSPEALELLQRYPWPGNVRELKNVVERMAILAEGETILPDDLPGDLRARAESIAPEPEPEPEGAAAPTTPEQLPSLAEVEKRHILRVLDVMGNNKVRSARVLGITPATLYNKLKVYRSQDSPPQ